MKNSILNKQELNNRLKGYEKIFRGRFLLLQNKVLRDEEYILWELSLSVLADWDKKHGEKYGTFSHTQKEIAILISWSETKVSRTSKALFKHNFWIKENSAKIRVNGFEIKEYLTPITKKYGVVNLEDYLLKKKTDFAYLTEEKSEITKEVSKENGDSRIQPLAEMQDDLPKDSLISPSKDKYSFAFRENTLTSSLSEEDIDWINNNLKLA